jgi:thiamine biosynthesis lipoprotein
MPVIYIILFFASFAAGEHAAAEDPFDVLDIDLDDTSVLYSFSHRAMGTEFKITIYDVDKSLNSDGAEAAASQAFSKIDSLERLISSWIPTSNTSKINRDAGQHWVKAVPATWHLFQLSKKIHVETEGAFDITVGPLIDAYRTDMPSDIDVQNAHALVGMGKVEFDPKDQNIRFKKEGMHVNFGGIGKGLAIDEAAEILEKYGVKSALISGGESSIYAIGAPPGRDFWRIAVYNPYNSSDRLAMVHLRDEALATSACDNVESCNVLDPRTGLQVEGLMSATVVASEGAVTDALSTSFFVLGTKGVRKYISEHSNVRAILVENPDDGEPKPVRIGRFKTK